MHLQKVTYVEGLSMITLSKTAFPKIHQGAKQNTVFTGNSLQLRITCFGEA